MCAVRRKLTSDTEPLPMLSSVEHVCRLHGLRLTMFETDIIFVTFEISSLTYPLNLLIYLHKIKSTVLGE